MTIAWVVQTSIITADNSLVQDYSHQINCYSLFQAINRLTPKSD